VHYTSPDAVAGSAAGGPAASGNWTLTAAHAELPGDNRLLKLRGAVQVTGQPPAATAPVTLATQSLDYDLKSQEATSADSVVLHMGTQQLQGTGLHANILLGTFSLDSQVHGRFSR
jgi:LPS export ABC transporter protein LptC